MSFKFTIETHDIYEDEIVRWGFSFIEELLVKYRLGKEEHKDKDITKLNISEEISKEVMDIIIYHRIFKINEDRKDKY